MDRSTDIAELVAQFYETMRSGDGDAAAGMISEADGVLFVGTDADEWWDDAEATRAAFREQLEATGGFDIEAGDPQGYVSGDVGWFADQPTMRLPDGTSVPMRLTGVAVRSDGAWSVVQGHLSVAASINESLFA